MVWWGAKYHEAALPATNSWKAGLYWEEITKPGEGDRRKIWGPVDGSVPETAVFTTRELVFDKLV